MKRPGLHVQMTVSEAEALLRVLDHVRRRTREGEDLCFGDKRKAARVQDRLLEAVQASGEHYDRRNTPGARPLAVYGGD